LIPADCITKLFRWEGNQEAEEIGLDYSNREDIEEEFSEIDDGIREDTEVDEGEYTEIDKGEDIEIDGDEPEEVRRRLEDISANSTVEIQVSYVFNQPGCGEKAAASSTAPECQDCGLPFQAPRSGLFLCLPCLSVRLLPGEDSFEAESDVGTLEVSLEDDVESGYYSLEARIKDYVESSQDTLKANLEDDVESPDNPPEAGDGAESGDTPIPGTPDPLEIRHEVVLAYGNNPLEAKPEDYVDSDSSSLMSVSGKSEEMGYKVAEVAEEGTDVERGKFII
jgi:hypothetical protein